MMKNTYKLHSLILIAIASSLLASCGKSFLEKYPVGQIPKEEMFLDVNGLKTGLNGAYSLVAKYHMGNFGMLGDIRGEDLVRLPSSDANMLGEYNYQVEVDNDLSYTTNIWRTLFEALNNTNNVINASEPLRTAYPQQAGAIDSVQGQALVLRALINFNLLQAFAQHYSYTSDGSHLGIPVLLETPFPGTPVTRQTAKESYGHVLTDLQNALILLKNHNNKNQLTASVEGVYAFLSRLHLYMENWDEAKKNADLVFQSNRFSLVQADQYLAMFNDPGQRTGSRASEIIWQFNLRQESSGYIQSIYADPDLFKFSPSTKLMNLYSEGDMRKEMFGENRFTSQQYTLKYSLAKDVGRDNWAVNYKLFRLAEIYLNRAEANWHLQNFTAAESDLKVIIGRAYSMAPEEVQLTHKNPSELLELIRDERRKELAFEGHRIFDITRYKQNMNRGEKCSAATCLVAYPNDLFALPIPQMELDANKAIQQNPGY